MNDKINWNQDNLGDRWEDFKAAIEVVRSTGNSTRDIIEKFSYDLYNKMMMVALRAEMEGRIKYFNLPIDVGNVVLDGEPLPKKYLSSCIYGALFLRPELVELWHRKREGNFYRFCTLNLYPLSS